MCNTCACSSGALISTVQGQPIAEELLLLQITVTRDEWPVTLEGHLGRMMIWGPFPGVQDGQWRAFPSCLLSPFTPEENSTVRADVQLHLLLNLYVSHCFCEDIPVPSKPVLLACQQNECTQHWWWRTSATTCLPSMVIQWLHSMVPAWSCVWGWLCWDPQIIAACHTCHSLC